MNLEPKAKPIRIRIVSGGDEHSSIDSLRNNYSLEDILPLVKDGRLYKWLTRVGESKAAESAKNLIRHNIDANSRDMVELTAAIFNTKAKSIEDLQRLWQKQYPRTFINYVKAYGITIGDIVSARNLYNSIGDSNSGITTEEWKNIFVTTLKKTPLSTVLDDFKKFKYAKPMDNMSWLEVLNYHSDLATDKNLYLLAEIAYKEPDLKDVAIEWYLKSARTYTKAKEWVNDQIHNLNFNNISSARKMYDSVCAKGFETDNNEWKRIFVMTLKKMPLSAVLEDFKEFKYAKPMDYMSWVDVLEFHSDFATDKELYLMAQATYDDASLKRKSEEWYRKSANTYYEAKEWVRNNLKRELDPKEQELFYTFAKTPSKFGDQFFNSTYPQDLVRFLRVLSSLYRTNNQPIVEQIKGSGRYSKYLAILKQLYYQNYRGNKQRCIEGLTRLTSNTSYFIDNYNRNILNKIIESIKNDTEYYGEYLSKLSYQNAIFFIVGLARIELEKRIELENEK